MNLKEQLDSLSLHSLLAEWHWADPESQKEQLEYVADIYAELTAEHYDIENNIEDEAWIITHHGRVIQQYARNMDLSKAFSFGNPTPRLAPSLPHTNMVLSA